MRIFIALYFIAVSVFAARTNTVDLVKFFDGGSLGNSIVDEVRPVLTITPIPKAVEVEAIKNDWEVKASEECVSLKSDVSVQSSEQLVAIVQDVQSKSVASAGSVGDASAINSQSFLAYIPNDVGIKSVQTAVSVRPVLPIQAQYSASPVKLSNFYLMELYNPAYCSTLYGLAHNPKADYNVVLKAIRLMEIIERKKETTYNDQ